MPIATLMLKAPRPGTVKTRLARDVGNLRAAEIYRTMAEEQIRRIPEAWEISIHYAPADAGEEMELWLGRDTARELRFSPQSEGDLGQRLRCAVQQEFDGGADAVFLLGGDCPGITTDYLRSAGSALKEHDLVVGPAMDGGYVLLGLKKPHPMLFEKITWSTDLVLVQTLEAAAECKLTWSLLQELEDVDDWPSYCRAFSPGFVK